MSTVKPFIVEEEAVPTASELNSTYDSLVTASGTIDTDNTATGWMTLKHINPVANRFNKLYYFEDDTTTEESINSSSWVTLTSTEGDCEVVLDYQPEQYEVLRIQASGLVSASEAVNDYDHVGTDTGKPNYYAFRLLLTYTDGSGSHTTSIGEWGYSFTTSGLDRNETTLGTVPNSSTPICWQTFQFSTLYIYNGAPSTTTLDKIELQASVFDTANTLAITRRSLTVVRMIT